MSVVGLEALRIHTKMGLDFLNLNNYFIMNTYDYYGFYKSILEQKWGLNFVPPVFEIQQIKCSEKLFASSFIFIEQIKKMKQKVEKMSLF